MIKFGALANARADIRKFVEGQASSIEHFYDEPTQSYRITVDQSRDPTKPIQGLTSTFTCLESRVEAGPVSTEARGQEDLPENKRQTDAQVSAMTLLSYGARALKADRSFWKSDDSGWAYCRVRALGTIARHAPELLAEHADQIAALLRPVWVAAVPAEGGAYGICELTIDPEPRTADGEPIPPGPAPSVGHDGTMELATERERQYTPNAYLTYWATYVGSRLTAGVGAEEFAEHKKSLNDWLFATLGEQIAFYEGKSPHADPQQLAWSLAGVVRNAESTDLVRNTGKYDMVNQGLVAFFAQQHERGDWDRGKPLFNYKLAGTAYCYGYETLAELLAIATDEGPVSRPLRNLLRPFAGALVRAFEYARDTAIPLNTDPTVLGWGSGHQPTRREPESWATASVYRFMQRLRILVGRWTSEEAQRLLDARPARPINMVERGASWNLGFGATGTQLSCYFALPIVARGEHATVTIPDPDELLIQKDHGRSAILFGPPGTGKTTMVEAVASMLAWPFIEISPAQFLDAGLDLVSARADTIFRQMMELDRCVVLLDEIDELVKNRTNEADPLERFFTTTMLPRLARLWEMGKILFFANTNDIGEIDSAIRRSQRFDAAILVLPPGESSKDSWLAKDKEVIAAATKTAIAKLLSDNPEPGEGVPAIPNAELVWYPLARFDQRESLIDSLKRSKGTLGTNRLRSALEPIGAALARQDWTNSVRASDGLKEQASSVTQALRLLRHAQRRGALTMHVVSDVPIHDAEEVNPTHKIWAVKARPDDPEAWAQKLKRQLDPGGTLH